MATQWPLVVQRLLVMLPALPGWSGVKVYDGLPVTGDAPSDYVTVGYVSSDVAGSYQTVMSPDGYQWEETGVVRSELASVSGDGDLSEVRGRMFGLLDALDASIRADRTLGGVLSREATTELVVDVMSVQNSAGAAQSVVFTVHYFTVT